VALLPAAGTDWDPVAEQLALAALLADFSSSASVATAQTRSNNAFGDLATVGPSVTITSKGTIAFCVWGGIVFGNVASASGRIAVAISGATTLAAAAANGFFASENGGLGVGSSGSIWRAYAITPGANTYTLKYNNIAANGTATFQDRWLTVIAP
jgi:hypothetical protein